MSGQVNAKLRCAVDLVGAAGRCGYFRSSVPVPYAAVAASMDAIGGHTVRLTERALEALAAVPGLTVYGPSRPERRSRRWLPSTWPAGIRRRWRRR